MKKYGLGWVLGALFLVSWAGHAWSGWEAYAAEQASHGETAGVWGESGYAWHFAATTLENWQSEFLQLLTFVVLTAYLVYRGSPESKDTNDRLEQELRRLTAEVARLADQRQAALAASRET